MKRLLPFLGLALLILPFGVHAELTNNGLLTDIASRYQTNAAAWASYITGRATWLYWTLVTISLVWTGGLMALRGGGLQEFFSEFVRFIMTTGFFWWLLVMAPTFVPGIYQSMSMIGANASGLSSDLKPSGILDIGFAVFNSVLDNSSLWEPVDSLFGFVMAFVILMVLALIAVNMVVLLVSGWVVGYAGIIFLGFGGSRWTSDMAISFYKTVLGIGIQLMTMVLLVGIGKTFMDDYYSRMAAGIELKETAVLMVASLVLLVLVNKVPQLISSIAGSNVGMSGLGSFGAGTGLAALGAAGAAASLGASMAAAGATNIAGGASALKAAFSQAMGNVESGTDVMAKFAGGSSDAGGSADASGSTSSSASAAGTANTTPFAQAAGMDTSSGSSLAASGNAGGNDSGFAGGATSADSGTSAGQGEAAAPPPSMAARAVASMAKAGRVTADAGANLAMGALDLGKQAVSNRLEQFSDRVSQTIGGQIASSINQGQEAPGPTFSGDSIAPAPADPEVAAFVQRNGSTG